MKHNFFKLTLTGILYCVLFFFQSNTINAQELPRELRGVWVATVLNIDWPSKADLKPKEQKAEIDKQLAYFEKIGLNAVFFQIRPNSNRLYRGSKEPWAEWLSGKQGKGPGYDPLKYLTEACHQRGMELHAWINPYRILLDSGKVPKTRKNVSKKHPEWVVNYGKGTMLNPGIPEVREYIGDLIRQLLTRYDIDGIHYDDYFYPYPYKGLPFPDDEEYAKYGKDFNSKADWRRHNVDALIHVTNDAIIDTKPRVKFGVSPFGVWRNIASDSTGSVTRAGAPTYDSLYTDTRKWMEKGWVDYLAPQLYWSIGFAPAAYDTLVKWWDKNAFDRHILIGQAPYKINNNYDSAWYDPSEIPNQIRLNRSLSSSIKGSIYFSAKHLISNPNNIADSLSKHFYAQKALPPLLPWKPQRPAVQPQKIKFKMLDSGLLIKWKKPESKPGFTLPAYYAICTEEDGSYKIIKVVSAQIKKVIVPISIPKEKIRVLGLNKHFSQGSL